MRCNCGINPKNLTDEHLFAESRELKMLPSLYGRVGYKSIGRVPKEFTLGKGHMLFFLYKPSYTRRRYHEVLKECAQRGINVKNEEYRWNIYHQDEYSKSYIESGKEADILRCRISERILNSPKNYFHYYHKRITKQEAINLLYR